ncbi:MAG: DUF4277 domain-containing protein [Gammaproteobacteria bacterium]|nr:DUF4277 domain-containing protein [Gammaproteobacteria bacterium]
MLNLKIERVDELPLLIEWVLRLHVVEIIDKIWRSAPQWQGLSYGQLSLLFIVYVIHQRSHRLSHMEDWVREHHQVLEACTTWSIRDKDATDDRLGNLLGQLGSSDEHRERFQREMSRHVIQAFALPTEVARYDTTSFSVHHNVEQEKAKPDSRLSFGYSKDKRPDLLQFKAGLGVLDPAGVPLLSQTLSGNVADDPLYIPAWREMVSIIGHGNFLYVADCKAAAVETRAIIAHEKGTYLFPIPMTGEIPTWLQEQVLNSSMPAEVVFPKASKQEKPPALGEGFAVQRTMNHPLDDGTVHTWDEQWFVTQSYAHAKRQTAALHARLAKAEAHLHTLRHKPDESDEQYRQRAQLVLQKYGVTKYLSIAVDESITQTKKYLKPGRPTPTSAFQIIEERTLKIDVHLDQLAIQQAEQLAGWRVFVSNRNMTIHEAVHFYRDEWLVEHGIHRFKHGALPALPLWLRIPERIVGLMMLLFVALQALTLIEFVARRNLQQNTAAIAGLYPGNPTRTTELPSAEALLGAFRQLHLVSLPNGGHSHLNEMLSPLHIQILSLLDLPLDIYDFSPPLSAAIHHRLDNIIPISDIASPLYQPP